MFSYEYFHTYFPETNFMTLPGHFPYANCPEPITTILFYFSLAFPLFLRKHNHLTNFLCKLVNAILYQITIYFFSLIWRTYIHHALYIPTCNCIPKQPHTNLQRSHILMRLHLRLLLLLLWRKNGFHGEGLFGAARLVDWEGVVLEAARRRVATVACCVWDNLWEKGR